MAWREACHFYSFETHPTHKEQSVHKDQNIWQVTADQSTILSETNTALSENGGKPAMTQDRINIVEPNGVERTRPLSPPGLTIGRGADNDLTLSYDLISRYHAQITYEGGLYYVTDLNSANGTYIDRDRLTPNMPTVWPSGKPLRVGKVIMYLEQLTQPQPNSVDSGETVIGQLSDDTLFRSGSNQGKRRVPLALVIVIGVILLCFLITLLTGIYFFAP